MTCSHTTDTSLKPDCYLIFSKNSLYPFIHAQAQHSPKVFFPQTPFGHGLGHFYVLTSFEWFLAEFVYKMDLAFQWIFRLGGRNWVKWNNLNILKEDVDLKAKHHVSKEDTDDN